MTSRHRCVFVYIQYKVYELNGVMFAHNAVSSLFRTVCQHQIMWFLAFRFDYTKHWTFSLRKNTSWRLPPHNFQRLYFHASVSVIMHVRMWALLLLHVFRCAQAFKHEYVLHVIVITVRVCVSASCQLCANQAHRVYPKLLCVLHSFH